MRTPEEHLAEITELIPRWPAQTLAVGEAAGRVLAEDITARLDSPRFDNSQMDGYAIPALEAGTYPVGPMIAAGSKPELLEGKASPIMTGAAVPADAKAIVPIEVCTPSSFDAAEITVPEATAGQYIRRRGSDIVAGTPLLRAGSVLSAAGVATLAAQSLPSVAVRHKAQILICTGGAEIGTRGPASIPDVNGPMLKALAARYGIEVVGMVRTNDDPQALRRDLRDAISRCHPDVIVTSGGISAGAFEVVRIVLREDGWFGHVDQQPGGPQGLATFEGIPVICLPGNPVSTLVSFRLFVAPVLGQAPEPVRAELGTPHKGLEGREQFLRGILSLEETRVRATPMGGASSHLISQAAESNALIRIPAGRKLKAGDHVNVYPL